MRRHTPVLMLVLASAWSVGSPLAAQQRSEPQALITLQAGVAGGHQLWHLDRQTLIYNGSTTNPPDTISLRRQVEPSLALGVVFQLFRSPSWGLFADVFYRTFTLDDTCAPVGAFQPDPPGTDTAHRNRTLCDNISAGGPSSGMIAVTLGGIARVAPRAAATPYVRGGATLTYLGGRMREVAASEGTPGIARVVILDESPERVAFGAAVAGGLQLRLSPGYQFRLEVRDNLVPLPAVTGPANSAAIAPSETRLTHQLGLLLGFDIVLEQRRGRRY